MKKKVDYLEYNELKLVELVDVEVSLHQNQNLKFNRGGNYGKNE